MFLELFAFFMFAAAVTFGVLFALKKTNVDDIKKDLVTLLTSTSIGKYGPAMSSKDANCVVDELAAEVDNNPKKLGVVLGGLCLTATGVDGMKEPVVCSKYVTTDEFEKISKKCLSK